MGDMPANGGPEPQPYVLREHRMGDMSVVISRHTALYATEYGWDIGFEAMIAKTCGEFLSKFDPSWERCWIAESAADSPVFLGFIAISKDREDPTTAQLRFFMVEQAARGMGLGGRLIQECVNFARARGYRRMILWTISILEGARRLYGRAGFQRLKTIPAKEQWGHTLENEIWEMTFAVPAESEQ